MKKTKEAKFWLDSKSVRGALVTTLPVIILLLKALGIEVGDGEQQVLVEGVTAIVGLLGTVMAIYGRVKASVALRLK